MNVMPLAHLYAEDMKVNETQLLLSRSSTSRGKKNK